MRSPMPRRREVSKEDADCEVLIKTGDQRGAGTDSKIFIILHENEGRTTQSIRLGNRFTTNCRGQLSKFYIQTNLTDFQTVSILEFYLEKFGIGELWFVQWIQVVILNEALGTPTIVFPVHRWVGSSDEHITLCPYDICLPQFAPPATLAFRSKELIKKRTNFQYAMKIENGPVQVWWYNEFTVLDIIKYNLEKWKFPKKQY